MCSLRVARRAKPGVDTFTFVRSDVARRAIPGVDTITFIHSDVARRASPGVDTKHNIITRGTEARPMKAKTVMARGVGPGDDITKSVVSVI